MEESIGKLGKSLGAFCNHLQSNCDALKLSVDRRPIPLDSASTTFLQCLNRRVSAASSDLNLLESMSCDTVSFEELLGHCTQVYNQNQFGLLALQEHLSSTGLYSPSADADEEEMELDDFSPQIGSTALRPLIELEDDLLLDDSLSLKQLGLSDASLATIASEADDCIKEQLSQPGSNILKDIEGGDLQPSADSNFLITASEDHYVKLPKHMKSLASWEDLGAAVERINSFLMTRRQATFQQDEIVSLGLGHKGRAYLLLLITMNSIVVEMVDGVICYRVSSAKQ